MRTIRAVTIALDDLLKLRSHDQDKQSVPGLSPNDKRYPYPAGDRSKDSLALVCP